MSKIVESYKANLTRIFGEHIFEIIEEKPRTDSAIPEVLFICRVRNTNSYYYWEDEKYLSENDKRKYPSFRLTYSIVITDRNENRIMKEIFNVEPKPEIRAMESAIGIYTAMFESTLDSFNLKTKKIFFK